MIILKMIKYLMIGKVDYQKQVIKIKLKIKINKKINHLEN